MDATLGNGTASRSPGGEPTTSPAIPAVRKASKYADPPVSTGPQPSTLSVTLLVLTIPTIILLLYNSPFPAEPPPSPLPLASPKAPFPLSPNFVIPPLLLYLSLILPYSPILTPWIFLPAITLSHIPSLNTGSKSAAVGFAIGTFISFHMYQSISLLLSPLGGRGWRRWIPTRTGGNSTKGEGNTSTTVDGYWESYPAEFGWDRICWAWELINSMRMVGWEHADITNSTPTKPQPPPPKLAIPSKTLTPKVVLYASLKRLLLLWVIADLAVWNIRVNDPGFFLPLLLHPKYASPPNEVGWCGTPLIEDPYYRTRPNFRRDVPHLGVSIAQDLTSDVIPTPKYFPLPRPTIVTHSCPVGEDIDGNQAGARCGNIFLMLLSNIWVIRQVVYSHVIFPVVLHLIRTLFQGACLAVGIEACFQLLRILFMGIAILLTPISPLLVSSRWFHPLVWQGSGLYPTGGIFEIFYQVRTNAGGRVLPIRAFWTRTWHALFRNTFLATSNVLLAPFSRDGSGNGVGRKKGFVAPLWVLTVVSFILSGVMHAVGIYVQTTEGESITPASSSLVFFRGQKAFMFFALQPLGMYLETFIFPKNDRRGLLWRKTLEVVVLVGWNSVTAMGFFQEYRFSGIWKVEAVPISLWLGVRGDGWWRWGRHVGVGSAGEVVGSWGWWEWSEGGRGWGVVM